MSERELEFEIKYNEYKRTIFNICYSYVRNIMDTEDIVQEVFLKFYLLNKKFASKDQEKYYLIRISINYSIDYLRKKKRQRIIFDDEIISRTLTPFKSNDELSVYDMVEILDDKYKEVIILKYVENADNKTIAKILQISESNVRKRLERAIKMLKDRWEEK